jgi:methionine sulfoxide reductase heme-binding subunit
MTWYLTRGAGTASLLLLTASVLLGILNWSRFTTPSWPRFLSNGLHRNISLLALSFLVVHIAMAVLDGFVSIPLIAAIVPFVSGYRPLWVGLGALAFDLLLAVAITSALRRRLGWRRWRAVHYVSYACWPIAMVHALGAGSDPGATWFTVLGVICWTAVLSAVLVRIAQGHRIASSTAS